MKKLLLFCVSVMMMTGTSLFAQDAEERDGESVWDSMFETAEESVEVVYPEVVQEPEMPGESEVSHIQNVEVEYYLDNEALFYNNGDLTNTDNSSYLTVDLTDDRLFVMTIDTGLSLGATVYDVFDVYADFYYQGYYGNDDLKYNGSISASKLYMVADLAEAMDLGFDLDLSIGRQKFELIDEDFKQYAMSDTLDAIVLSYESESGLGVDFLVDFFSMNAPVDSVYSLYRNSDSSTVDGFNGNVNNYRFGLVPAFEASFGDFAVDAKPFVFFSKIGATGANTYDEGGYEMSGIGYDGNFADNDWVLQAGIDALVEYDFIDFLVEAGYSYGIDRKAVDLPDVNISGVMAHVSAESDFSFIGLEPAYVKLDALYVSGAKTDEEGNFLNYGYVGNKSDKVGGMLFTYYYGNYPFAVVNTTGIDFEPFESSRRAPTMAFSASVGVEEMDLLDSGLEGNGLNANLEGWLYFDTSSTSMNTNLSLSADTYDQLRLGNFMGIEADMEISYAFCEGNFETGLKGAIFVPYDFFFYPISLDESPFGTSTFVGIYGFTSLKF